MATADKVRPRTFDELIASGWQSKSIKREIYDNFVPMLANGDELFPGIVGFEDTVIPEINLALLSGHDVLFLGEKGQAKSRLMRSLVAFLGNGQNDVVPRYANPTKKFRAVPHSVPREEYA